MRPEERKTVKYPPQSINVFISELIYVVLQLIKCSASQFHTKVTSALLQSENHQRIQTSEELEPKKQRRNNEADLTGFLRLSEGRESISKDAQGSERVTAEQQQQRLSHGETTTLFFMFRYKNSRQGEHQPRSWSDKARVRWKQKHSFCPII